MKLIISIIIYIYSQMTNGSLHQTTLKRVLAVPQSKSSLLFHLWPADQLTGTVATAPLPIK